MNTALQDSFEYRHKKFDQGKRPRSDSLGSSSADYGSIKLEGEGIQTESPLQQTTFQHASAFNWYPKQSKSNKTLDTVNKDNFSAVPPAKRPRLNSFQDAIRQHTSTALNAATTVVPSPVGILNKISEETIHSICKYHGNMVRKFPKKERTPKDQERRDKNTIACRMSRRVKKLEHIAIEEQYKEFSQQTFNILEQSLRATAYFHQLMKLKSESQEEIGETEIWKKSNDNKPSTSQPQKKPFTIAFLTGKE